MAVKVFSCMPYGLEGKLVEVEADILQGMPAFNIVGLGDAAVQESKERIRSAIKNSGFDYPQTRKIINLAPAHLKKHGPHFDLPIAVALLAASGQITGPAHQLLQDSIIVGELALDGTIRRINSVLTICLFAKANGWKKIIVPADNFEEASLVSGIEIIPVQNLAQTVNFCGTIFHDQNGLNKPKNTSKSVRAHTHLQQKITRSTSQKSVPGHTNLQSKKISSTTAVTTSDVIDFSEISGHEQPKRALTIAAAGGHHILLSGPPGVGKTMLAKALPGILPELSSDELLEVMQIYSCAGLFDQSKTARPFRQVHTTATLLSLTGGGANLKPGEISLAHRGVLFMDEIAEFPRAHLESLRQPLQEKEIHLSRASGSARFPAGFFLVAGMNPCPCGFNGDSHKNCICKPAQILQYRKKLSGPILDRIDLNVNVLRQNMQQDPTETSELIRQKIINAREIQKNRFAGTEILNSQMTPRLIKKHCAINQTAQEILEESAEKYHFSGRSVHSILKVSRTIADLNGHDKIDTADLSEALQYRNYAAAVPSP